MILTTILLIALAILAVITALTISVGGVAFIVVFGDVIVFALLIRMLVKRLIKKKR